MTLYSPPIHPFSQGILYMSQTLDERQSIESKSTGSHVLLVKVSESDLIPDFSIFFAPILIQILQAFFL